MLERSIIQQRGFRNIVDGNDITGFQVPIRLNYYRGVWMSQVRPITVTVDGTTYEGDQIAWEVSGKTIAQKDLADSTDIHWNSLDAAMLLVKKAGGLKPGIHDIEVFNEFSASYLPPRLDLMFSRPEQRRMVLVR
ncbi:hypothetical protein FV139_14160 [Parahaliea maris]|uniref:C-deglycosylation enzyme beta subunit n=1 Tax=Parahaliea maris TaxID=2716870 RepID=A0A5C8ZWN2_9GAMM|nr:DUF6379 domain-containing protein [Parahaliea maris]TXS91877.1 hypothetical protein FV139_14160 [Parahaliea maris]